MSAPDSIVKEIEAALTTAELLLADGLERREYDGAVYAAAASALERARLAVRGYINLERSADD